MRCMHLICLAFQAKTVQSSLQHEGLLDGYEIIVQRTINPRRRVRRGEQIADVGVGGIGRISKQERTQRVGC